MITNTVHMDFCYQSGTTRSPEAYETLLLDVMTGEATLFIRRDEVEAQWRLMTPIEEAWAQEKPTEIPRYASGTDGPVQAGELLTRNGHKWRKLNETVSGCE
jgi:glucose-6-phosphate 1-dehydrogenase